MKNMTVTQLKAKMDSGEQFHLIDVREPNEFKEFNIGGTLVPLGKIQSMQIDELEELRNEELIVYCRSGRRSATACSFLETLGFANTVNLEGGVLAWQEMFGSLKYDKK